MAMHNPVAWVIGDEFDVPRLSDTDFFAQLDTTRPGLQDIPAAAARGDFATARRLFAAEVRGPLAKAIQGSTVIMPRLRDYIEKVSRQDPRSSTNSAARGEIAAAHRALMASVVHAWNLDAASRTALPM